MKMTEQAPEKNRTYGFILLLCIIAIGVVAIYRFYPMLQPKTVNVLTSSTLMDVIDITELSTAEFRYKGIAPIYKDEQHSKLRCSICYNAVVKAGINMKDVVLEVDAENHRVLASLPEITIKTAIVDEKSMSIIPKSTKIDIKDMLIACKKDVENEATQSEELLLSAHENLKMIIEGLLLPILKAHDYRLEWNN